MAVRQNSIFWHTAMVFARRARVLSEWFRWQELEGCWHTLLKMRWQLMG